MTYTLTARLGLPFWTSDSDIPTRDEFNLVTSYLESAMVIGTQGTASALPTPGTTDRLYLETDTGIVRWDTGSGWVVVGRVVDGTRTVRLLTGQTAHMDEWKDTNGNVMSWVDPSGGFHGHYSDDANGWDYLLGYQAGWNNAGGYTYPLTVRKSGENCQLRGQIQVLSAGAESLLTSLPDAYIPLNTQRFPVWVSATGADLGGSFNVMLKMIGRKDGSGDIPGRIYLHPAGAGPAVGSVLDINCTYLLGGLKVNGMTV